MLCLVSSVIVDLLWRPDFAVQIVNMSSENEGEFSGNYMNFSEDEDDYFQMRVREELTGEDREDRPKRKSLRIEYLFGTFFPFRNFFFHWLTTISTKNDFGEHKVLLKTTFLHIVLLSSSRSLSFYFFNFDMVFWQLSNALTEWLFVRVMKQASVCVCVCRCVRGEWVSVKRIYMSVLIIIFITLYLCGVEYNSCSCLLYETLQRSWPMNFGCLNGSRCLDELVR